MGDKVVSLNGDPVTTDRVPRQSVINTARRLLEMAEAGEVVGIALAMLHHDRLSSYEVAGTIGGYGMIGALRCAEVELVNAARDS